MSQGGAHSHLLADQCMSPLRTKQAAAGLSATEQSVMRWCIMMLVGGCGTRFYDYQFRIEGWFEDLNAGA